VLAVDPDPAALRTLADALGKDGYDVTTAQDFDGAMQQLTAGGIDALITAHHLGAHNGLHLVLRARIISADAIVVVVSHAGDPYMEREAALLGGIGVIAAEHDPSPALAALREAVPAA
jgi:DNA-binding response OmpR family regulator